MLIFFVFFSALYLHILFLFFLEEETKIASGTAQQHVFFNFFLFFVFFTYKSKVVDLEDQFRNYNNTKYKL